MKLGISSLGHLADRALRGKFKNSHDLLMSSTERALKFAERYDINLVEIILDPPAIYTEENRRRFIDLCNSYSIEKQVHAPFTDVSMCSFNINISNATVKSFIDAAEISNEIGSEIMVVHPGVGHYLISSIRELNKIQLSRAVSDLLDATKDLNVKICIENMPKGTNMLGNVPDIEEFLKNLNRNDIYLIFDTSHAWTLDLDVDLYWERFHDIVKNVHLADNTNKDTDLHPALGDGEVNFKEILNIIKKYDYEGALIIEIITGRALRRSIDFINKLL